jgi:hypothetical protein
VSGISTGTPTEKRLLENAGLPRSGHDGEQEVKDGSSLLATRTELDMTMLPKAGTPGSIVATSVSLYDSFRRRSPVLTD